MTVTPATIQALPSLEFASVLDATVQIYIDEATCFMHESTWGDCFDTGVTYLAAHLLAVAMKGSFGAAGPVTMNKAGPISQSYAGYSTFGSTGGDNLNATSYGRQFQVLRSHLGIIGFVAVGSTSNSQRP